jgi:hypothetical protein
VRERELAHGPGAGVGKNFLLPAAQLAKPPKITVIFGSPSIFGGFCRKLCRPKINHHKLFCPLKNTRLPVVVIYDGWAILSCHRFASEFFKKLQKIV